MAPESFGDAIARYHVAQEVPMEYAEGYVYALCSRCGLRVGGWGKNVLLDGGHVRALCQDCFAIEHPDPAYVLSPEEFVMLLLTKHEHGAPA